MSLLLLRSSSLCGVSENYITLSAWPYKAYVIRYLKEAAWSDKLSLRHKYEKGGTTKV